MPTVALANDRAKAGAAFRRFQASDSFLAFDTETTGLYVRTPYGDTPRTIQFSWRPWTEAVVFETTEEMLPAIAAFFAEADAVVGHNVRFDVHAMASVDINLYDDFDPGAVHDTVWLSRLYDERERAQLKPLAKRHLAADAADEQTALKRLMTKNNWTWETVPIKHLIEYGGLDAIYTGQLFDLFHPKVAYAWDAYYREQQLSATLFKMEREGILVDTEAMADVTEVLREEVERSEVLLERLAPGMNPNAPAQLKGALRDRGIEVENTQKATLMRHRGDSLIETLLEFRAAKKMVGTYLEPWAKLITPEGRIHPNFNQLGAATGRFSSSDPNLQNIKRGSALRNMFVAAEGHKLVVADWNQMELRLYAHFAEDENMRAAFISGDDIYQQAGDLMGVPRQIGKMIMLASVYGAGPRTLKRNCINQAFQFGTPELVPQLEDYDWEALYDLFHESYNIKELARKCELQARRREWDGDPYIRTLGGRRQRPKKVVLPAVNGYRQTIYTYKDLANSLVQGSSADMMKDALIAVDAAGYGDMLRLTVHDEMVLEVPDDEVAEAIEVVEAIMTHNEFIPPLTVEASYAQRYGDAK